MQTRFPAYFQVPLGSLKKATNKDTCTSRVGLSRVPCLPSLLNPTDGPPCHRLSCSHLSADGNKTQELLAAPQ